MTYIFICKQTEMVVSFHIPNELWLLNRFERRSLAALQQSFRLKNQSYTCSSSFRSFAIAIEISISVKCESIYFSSRSVNTPFAFLLPSLATCPIDVAYMMHTLESASSYLAES